MQLSPILSFVFAWQTIGHKHGYLFGKSVGTVRRRAEKAGRGRYASRGLLQCSRVFRAPRIKKFGYTALPNDAVVAMEPLVPVPVSFDFSNTFD